jgi:myo-inositol-1(or 4)-monophosphatase
MPDERIKETLLTALNAAGKILAASLHERRIVARKTELSLVTATDKAAETVILQTIQLVFPDHAFLAEESPPQGQSESRWIIDPLDGTTNFAHTYPVGCVSIAFEQEGLLIAAGVYDPFREELFPPVQAI